MVLGRGLVLTGALEPLTRGLAVLWQVSRTLAMFAVILSCLLLSGIINDTPVVVLMTPVLVGLAARTASSPAPLLMPMNFAVLIGGMGTAIGTSTNLLVVSLTEELGGGRIGIFDFTPIVAIAALVALPYLLFIAPRILANAGKPASDMAPREFFAVLRVAPGSFADGSTIAEILNRGSHIDIRAMQTADGKFAARLPTYQVRAGFQLHLRGTPTELKEAERLLGGELRADDTGGYGARRNGSRVPEEEVHLVEMIVSADSALIGKTLGDLRFGLRYGLALLGIHREQTPPRNPDVRQWTVQAGDVLLAQGTTTRVQAAKEEGELLALDGSISLPRTAKAPLALAIMLGVVALAASGLVPIAVAAVTGAVLMLLTGCILPRNLGSSVNAEVILLIPASLALGKALTITGGADLIADVLLRVIAGMPVNVVLAGIIALMSLMTNFVSNNAAAVIGTPIAISMALDLGYPPEPFALAVLFGCNLCYATPIGYQTNLIIMGAAGYRFGDFMRAGLPLVVLMVTALAWLLPWWYGI